MANERTFDEIHRDYNGLVHKVLSKFCSRNSIEDVCQDVFIQVFRSLDKVLTSKKLGGWIAVVATRCAIKHRNKAFRRRETPSDLLENTLTGRSSALDVRIDIERWIEGLDETDRQIIKQLYVQGYTSEQAALAMGMNPNTLRGKAMASRQKLKQTDIVASI